MQFLRCCWQGRCRTFPSSSTVVLGELCEGLRILSESKIHLAFSELAVLMKQEGQEDLSLSC